MSQPESQIPNPKSQLLWANTTFLLAAAAAEQFPPHHRPELALIGRSNVGKSSLLNALTGRKNLARASVTPGRTQQIVFFDLDSRMMLADLPGYGFAKAPKAEIRSWTALVRGYLAERRQLICVLLLLDARHGALPADYEMMGYLDAAAVNYQVVLTKADQVRKAAELETTQAAIIKLLKKHPAARPDIMVTSAEKNTGIDALRDFAASFLAE
jgi:GTP-binding protein